LNDANAIIERLGALFVESFHVEVPSPDTDLLETGILDSFQFVELLFELEQRFGFRIKIESIDLDDLRTLARIARLVAANGEAAEPAAARPSSGAADLPAASAPPEPLHT
jgi:D-alanine--poly(phosphoribitol) ligase subunit 2